MQKEITNDTELNTDADSVTLSAWLGALRTIFWNLFMKQIYVCTLCLWMGSWASEYCYTHEWKWVWSLPLFFGGGIYYTYLTKKRA